MVRHAFVAILWLCPALAAAQSASDTNTHADKLFKDGLNQRNAGDVDHACPMFEDSLKLLDRPNVRLNLADCYERQGRTASARDEFLRAAQQADARGNADRAAYARKRAKALEPKLAKLAKLAISVPPASRLPGLAVQRDGVAVPSKEFGRPLPVDPGSHTVEASAPGYQTWSTQVDVTKPGEAVPVQVPRLTPMPAKDEPPKIAAGPANVEPSNPLAPKAAVPAANPDADKQQPNDPTVADRDPEPSNPQATSSASPETASKVVPLVVGAGALALLAGGLGFELSAESKYDAAKSEMMSQLRRESLYSSANTKRYVAEALAVSGLAVGGAAVWLYLRGDNRERDATTDTTVHVVPTATGLALSGQF
jgi:tetratricopeptide (TPR) repeat protein